MNSGFLRDWNYGWVWGHPCSVYSCSSAVNLKPLPIRNGQCPAGFSLKEFKAACPVTGLVVLRAYSRATSRNATHFLKSLITQLPFTLSSIQVDGGSEFRDEFEQACKDLSIKLYVLPPRKPEWNGCVERANGTSRYEFYPFYQGSLTVAAVNRALADYQWTYNYYRPHDSLALCGGAADIVVESGRGRNRPLCG